MITELDPIIQTVNGTEYQMPYVTPGDAIGQRYFCKPGIIKLLDKSALKMRVNETRRINITASWLD